MNRYCLFPASSGLLLILLLVCAPVMGTETENFNLAVPPAPGHVTVDGKTDDWDLTGGIFACGDVENQRDKFGVWIHAMYDADNIYLLARWMDPTPMNNPGSSKGDYGFNGDCLQVRFVIAPDVNAPGVVSPGRDAKDAPGARTSHLNCWRDRDGLDVVNIAWGRNFNEGEIRDAKSDGAAQAFQLLPDGKGYIQEISIPWRHLCKPGLMPTKGSKILMTIEPNFTVGTGGRLTIKDIFKPGVALDRVFTFSANDGWGYASLEESSKGIPRPVRLSDGREFPVRMENGITVVDWTGLIKSRESEGFKSIKFTMPEDGYASLNIFRADGSVARQLLACAFCTRGEHEVKWDGLTTMSIRRPGQPVEAGDYTWEGICHTGIGLRLRGWAANSGSAPWGGGTWGADHGNPVACAADGERVYVGWHGGEGAQPLLACDPNGNVKWKNIRGGIATASMLAADEDTVYAWNDIGQYATRAIYRLDARSGRYTEWSDLKSTDLTMKQLWGDTKDAPESPSAFAAKGGSVFIGFNSKNTVMVVDHKTGKVLKSLNVPKPGPIVAASASQFFAFSDCTLVSVDVKNGALREIVKLDCSDKNWVSALAMDKAGRFFVGLRGETHQIQVYSPEGKLERTIGRKGGRALLGPWTPDGLLNIASLAVDAAGKLWVAEDDGSPRRVSVWDIQTGEFKMEFFGATGYGAIGGCINPVDPYVMVGQGCEWRIDPKTGKAACLGVITRDGMGASRFGFGPNGKLYLATTPGFLHGEDPIRIYERIGDADYKLRTVLTPDSKNKLTKVWADENGDGKEQSEEVVSYHKDLGGWFQGWYMPMTPDLTFYGSMFKVKVSGWSACGAPKYDIEQSKLLPGPADGKYRGGMGAQHNHGSEDNQLILWNSTYGDDYSTVDCYDIASGKPMWTYPSNYTGIHGSHRAGVPEVGMMRGQYDIVGAAKLPQPVGNIWVIPTNKGEWHVLTERGYYLTRLFQGDPMKNVYPEKAVPGAILDDCPPGAGEEAFGGSIIQDKDGKISVQAGHTSFWNAEVTGLDTIKALAGSGKIVLSAEDVKTAQSFRERYTQLAAGVKQFKVKKAAPAFTGDFEKDFASIDNAAYQKMPAAAVRTALAWDENNLYAAWEVKDDTPWVNGADAPEFMYTRGDTVDLQLGTDPNAKRTEAVLGDLRLSIGPFQGKTVAVLYQKAAAEKHPMTFNSGVIKNYVVDSVTFLSAKDLKIEVKRDKVKRQYTVEAAIPLALLGLSPKAGLKIRGDFGVTHSNKEGNDTALRTYWSNQSTGLVSDEVIELQLAPQNWGDFLFSE